MKDGLLRSARNDVDRSWEKKIPAYAGMTVFLGLRFYAAVSFVDGKAVDASFRRHDEFWMSGA